VRGFLAVYAPSAVTGKIAIFTVGRSTLEVKRAA
jgi:hypothetical protein